MYNTAIARFMVDYYSAENLRDFVQEIYPYKQDNKFMLISSNPNRLDYPQEITQFLNEETHIGDYLYEYITTFYYIVNYSQITIQGMFPEKHDQILQLIFEIKQSPFYNGYLEFMCRYFNKHFNTIIRQQMENYNRIDLLNFIETKYSFVEQTYKFYKFYVAFWLNSVYRMYSQVNFDMDDFFTQIIDRKLYTFDTKQSETTLRIYNKEQQQIMYQYNVFKFDFTKINSLFDSLLTKTNTENHAYAYNGIRRMSLIDVMLYNYNTLHNVVNQNNHYKIMPIFNNPINISNIYKLYDNTLFECSVCKNCYHIDELFKYDCCNNYICPYCIYEHNIQHTIQATNTNNGFICPCCNSDIHSIKITAYVFCGNIPDFEVSMLWNDNDSCPCEEFLEEEFLEEEYLEEGSCEKQ